jgi:hypothetical protein
MPRWQADDSIRCTLRIWHHHVLLTSGGLLATYQSNTHRIQEALNMTAARSFNAPD